MGDGAGERGAWPADGGACRARGRVARRTAAGRGGNSALGGKHLSHTSMQDVFMVTEEQTVDHFLASVPTQPRRNKQLRAGAAVEIGGRVVEAVMHDGQDGYRTKGEDGNPYVRRKTSADGAAVWRVRTRTAYTGLCLSPMLFMFLEAHQSASGSEWWQAGTRTKRCWSCLTGWLRRIAGCAPNGRPTWRAAKHGTMCSLTTSATRTAKSNPGILARPV